MNNNSKCTVNHPTNVTEYLDSIKKDFQEKYHLKQKDFQSALSNYPAMSNMLKTHGYNEILECAAVSISIEPAKLEKYPMGGSSNGMTNGAYRFVLQDLLNNIIHYDWLYSRLEDDISRFVFTNLIGYRLLPTKIFLQSAYDSQYPQYLDKNIISCGKDEVFVDCGAFIGDTTEEFIRPFGNYKHLYVYEPAQNNIHICRNNLKKYRNVTVRQCGVGEKSCFLSIEGKGSSSSFVKNLNPPNDIDENILEPITFLKMDIGGFEIPALLGAKRHIRDDFPKLAVCTSQYYQ